MLRPCACLVFLVLAAPAPADDATPAAARRRWLKGNAAEARALAETLAASPQHKTAATLLVSRTWQSEGDYDKALAVVDDALKAAADDPDLRARRAELLYLRGRWEDALADAEKAIARKDDQFLARFVRAEIYRDRGELPKADVEFRWFARTYTARNRANADVTDPDALLLIGLAGAENARWHNLADQFQFILNELLSDVLKFDADEWRAEYQAGMLLLEKYNRPEALAAFDKALKINPRAAEALVGKGLAALQQYELKDADQFAQRALGINPRLPEALRLAADVQLNAGDVDAARELLEKARTVNPRDEATLGRLAAAHFLRHEQTQIDALAAEVKKFDPMPGRFYFELAERLDERRLFSEAGKYYRQALELRPNLPDVRTSLGMLAMRMGEEDEARTLLTEAFKSDPFNVRTANSLKVLHHLEGYETRKTEHFLLRFDPKNDAVLANYVADYLEEVYRRLSGQFDYRPPGPILVEIFNSHEMFSGRVVALPDLHTIGASTGRMAAFVSPQGRGVRKPFNWGRVVRHELVHIFNLEQTAFQVPHWLTEGLAVRNEGFPRPPSWNEVLIERVGADDLLNLKTIDLGFIRPRSPQEWTLAYCQAQLYVDYLTDKHGPKAVAGLLTAYRDGRDTADAIKQVCGVDVAAFEAGYKASVKELAAKLRGRPPEKPLTLAQLQAAVAKDPDDLDLAARLADQYLRRRRAREARELVDRVLSRKATHGMALYVKAQLLRNAGEDDQAGLLLEGAAKQEPPEPKVLKLLGKLYYDAGKLEQAAAVFERGRKAEPYEPSWLEDLARVYKQTGALEKRIAAMEELAPTDADEFEVRRELAELLMQVGRYADAEHWARQALEIDVRDKASRAALVEALKRQGKDGEAERIKGLLGG
jgi:tetratricopeptide (TPR) repeat protein